MIFGNNIEQMGFEKSGWVIVDQSADGNTVYMGKPSTAGAKPADAAWHIRKVTTEDQADGSKITTAQYAEPEGKCVWADRKNLEYLPNLKDIRKFRLHLNYPTPDGEYEVEYSFEPGMTWREWVDSKYNVDNFVIQTVITMNFSREEMVVCFDRACIGTSYPEDLILEFKEDFDVYYEEDCTI